MSKLQMINQVVVKNPTNATAYHKGVAIPAGEQKVFEGQAVPGQPAPPPEGTGKPQPQLSDDEKLRALLGDSVPNVVKGLAALSLDGLDQAEALEHASDKPRKGVLDGIAAERLARAANTLDEDADPSKEDATAEPDQD